MIETSSDADIEKTLSGKSDSDIELLGIGIFGPHDEVNQLTKKFGLAISKVREVVQKYNDYAKFMPHYLGSHVVDRDAQTAKVYMQVEALSGAYKMDAQIRMPNKPNVENGWETIESTFEGGSVQDFKAIWRLKSIDDDHTFLSLEVFLAPKLPIPMPASVMNKENLKGAFNGVNAMRDRAEHPPQ